MTIVKDLRNMFEGARDQSQRPTCLAFAMSDAHAAKRSGCGLLSVEFLFYHAIKRTVTPSTTQGVTVTKVIEALALDGQPHEAEWPYFPTTPAPAAWTPPAGANVYRAGADRLTTSPASILSALDSDKPSVITLLLSHRFYSPSAEGVVEVVPGDPDTGNHAVVAVGYGTHSGETFILVRNSWGQGWGLQGYGWLSTQYLSTRLRTVSYIERLL